MSESENKAGPVLSDDVQELQGTFPNQAAIEDAMGRLALQGFDRADFSLPDPDAPLGTPDSASAATDEIDVTQVRTMASGLTGAAAGTGVAAALVATGGLALPIVAAVAGVSALGAAAATTGAGVAREDAAKEEQDRLAAEGRLVLAVRIRSPQMRELAVAAMREAGATDLVEITGAAGATGSGVSSSSWTG